ncbi:ABC transporter ATP-binding protein [Arcticibacterium luteifluviistationis]|uniref:ABC transporter n=1 Tax=Arcticibacterium luteifluviistationis TaxID=1784714 RepID=A0A2Z4G6X8_9BACT|nr:ABC transporter ATP-binding protein [Arcticibacterium luteifluviistationis]AWV96912.1 ABC transporter [Arcticibacterium luteifluviistationis]
MLQIKNFKKEYQGHLILDIPFLDIPEGVSWFQGVNGSGKSTFFKAISGIIPFEGAVLFDGHLDLHKSPVEFRRIINYSFAEPRFPDYLSGKDILDYYEKIYKTDSSEIEELVEVFGVATFYQTAIGTYSSGMLKKISLIAAMIGEAKILALDEPLTTIDKESQEKLLGILAKKVSQGVNILIASHHELPESSLIVNHHFKVENQTIRKQ